MPVQLCFHFRKSVFELRHEKTSILPEYPHTQTGTLLKHDQAQISFAVTAKRLCFHYKDSTIPRLPINLKFSASCHLCLHSSVCVAPVRNPHCWFSHDVAHFILFVNNFLMLLHFHGYQTFCCLLAILFRPQPL